MGYVAPTWQNGGPPALNAKNMQDISDNLAYVSNNMVNPNLLDNWYFGNPVNQRGQTTYSGAGYSIDRWKTQNDTNLTVGDGFCTLNGLWDIRQILENLPKATYTASILFRNSTANALQIIVGNNTGVDNSVAISHDASGVLAGTISNINFSNFIISLSGGGSVDIIAVKLELGTQQTLAHQENGVWVLNEIPDYGEQLRRCQRYCFVWGYGIKQTSCLAVMQCVQPGVLFGLIPTPVTLRNNPVVTGGSLTTFAGKVTSLTSLIACANGIRAVANIEGTSTSQGQAVGIENADDNGRVIFSADL